MIRPADFLYVLAATVAAPIWLPRMIATGKIRTDWAGRFGRSAVRAPDGRRRLLIHGVSVGEVNAARELVAALRPEFDVIVSTTTDTGFARAVNVYGAENVVRYPFDLTFAVRRFLDAVRPDAVALVELEVWPGFVHECVSMGIPVAVVNGRLSARSFAGYRRIRPLIRRSFARLAAVGAQDEAIARRFVDLGVPQERVTVTGTMKWDTAALLDEVPGADDLARDLGIDCSRAVVVAGSTGPGEEALIHEAVPEDVQLIVAPRKPERFDEAARALPGCVRRSRGSGARGQGNSSFPRRRESNLGDGLHNVDSRLRGNDDERLSSASPRHPVRSQPRFLLDTIGELRAAYSLADVVIVGRTFTNLHGSDMIEPVALGKAVIVGPDVSNFESAALALLDGGGLVQVTADGLGETVRRLLADPQECRRLGEAGRAVIRAHQGATQRHVGMLRGVIQRSTAS